MKFEPVTEAYFGKTKELLEAEHIINGIIKKFKVPFEKVGKRIIDAAKLNNSAENRKLEKLFCKQFGFAEFKLHWDGSDVANAFSVSRGIITLVSGGMPVLPVKQADGGYYDSKHSYCCVVCVYAGLIDAGLTAEELVAVILHEIGHNFQCTPITNITTFTDPLWIPVSAYKMVQHWREIGNSLAKAASGHKMGMSSKTAEQAKKAGETVGQAIGDALGHLIMAFVWRNEAMSDMWSLFRDMLPDVLKEEFEALDDWILSNKNQILNKWKRYVEAYRKYKKQIEADKNRIAWGVLFNNTYNLAWLFFGGGLLALKQFYHAQSGYSGEVFADSFATAYGYGPAATSTFTKFEQLRLSNPHLGLNKNNDNSVFNQYIYIMLELTTSCLDPHPMNQTRIKNQINKLRKELESDEVPASLKAKIKKDLDNAEAIYQAYIEMPEQYRHLAVIQNMHHFNEMYFGGKLEVRDILNKVLNVGKAEA